jgi:CHAT domain-containing protein/tetratricopeptide (TPR) repeat protein
MINNFMKYSIVIILSVINFEFGYSNVIDSSLFYIKKGTDYYYSDDYIHCELYWKKALEYRKKIYAPQSVYIGNALNNLGLLYLNIWDFEESINYLEKAKSIYLANNNILELSVANSNLGKNFQLLGNFDLAEQYINESLNIIKNMTSKEANIRKAEFLMRLGLLENERKNYQKAANYFNEVIQKYTNIFPAQVNHNLLYNISTSYMSLKKYDSTLIYLKKALQLSQQNVDLSEIYYAKSLHLFTLYYINQGNEEASLMSLNQEFDILNSIHVDSSNYYKIYLDFAQHYSTFKKYEKGLIYYQKALNFLTKSNSDDYLITPDAHQFINPINGIEILRKKADLLLTYFKHTSDVKYLEAAINAVSVASELINNSRNGFLSLESKLSLAENESSVYYLGLKAASKLYAITNDFIYIEKAFSFSEENKSSILESALQEQKAKTFGDIPEKLLQEEVKFKRDIAFYNELLYKERLKKTPDNEKVRNLQSYLLHNNEQYERFKTNLEKNYKNYYQLKYLSPYNTISEIQDHLNKNTSILEYSLTDSSLYIFQIDKENAQFFTFPIDSSFYQNANTFLNQFKNFNYIAQGKNIYTEYQQSGTALYNYLIGQADTSTLKKHLVIIPDNILSYIPFEALVKPGDKNVPDSYANIHYLLYDYAISYSYSAHLFAESNIKSGRKIWNKALSVAPEYISPIPNRPKAVHQDVYRSQRDNLEPLPFALEEANLVSKITFGYELAGKEATEENFLNYSPKYNILHLAMHTLIDDNNPLFSRLVFYADSNSSDEGFLTTNEIFSLKLKADMTVLSACSSGEGEYRKGEGVLSLARSFFYAGCPCLVMTLWNVDDESGLRLMKDYYKHLRKGLSKAKSMQLAKIEYITKISPEKQHPFYWSNYICIGNASPLYYPSWIYLILVISLVMIFLAFYLKFSRKHKKVVLSEPNVPINQKKYTSLN